MTNQFPRFEDGDVIITAENGTIWQLHSAFLKNQSQLFKRLFDSTESGSAPATKRSKTAKSKVKWEIDCLVRPDDRRLANFVLREKSRKNVFTLPATLDGTIPEYVHIYDELFRCIYSINFEFTAVDFEDFIFEVTSLLQAAESIEAESCVRSPIESHLLRHGQILWQHIRQHPESCADLAIRLQSPTIYREAMIHVVGRWTLVDKAIRSQLRLYRYGQIIEKITQEKVKQGNELKKLIEKQLIDFVPDQMGHEASSTGPKVVRSPYAGDVYLWMALNLVKHFITMAIHDNLHHTAADGGFYFYSMISKGGAAYLSQDSLSAFHASFPMSSKGREVLANALFEIKAEMRPIVASLMQDRAQTIIGASPLEYLTNTVFSRHEFPWLLSSQGSRNAKDKHIADEELSSSVESEDGDENY